MRTILETDQDYTCDIQAPCFRLLSPDEVELVKESKTQVLFRKGDQLTKQGAFASFVLFVAEGLAKQYLEGEGNRNYNLKIVQPGEFVGLSAIFTRNTFPYSAIALTGCRVFLVEKDAISKLIKQNGDFGFGIIHRYCNQNADLLGTVSSLMYKQMNGRLAETLLYLDGLKKTYPDVFQLLSRKDLADFAGISTESAVKLLKAFEKDGLIRLMEKDIELLNPTNLSEVSRKG